MMGNGVRIPSPDDPGGRNLSPLQVKGLTTVKDVSVGAGHIAALLADGSLRAVGDERHGESDAARPARTRSCRSRWPS